MTVKYQVRELERAWGWRGGRGIDYPRLPKPRFSAPRTVPTPSMEITVLEEDGKARSLSFYWAKVRRGKESRRSKYKDQEAWLWW